MFRNHFIHYNLSHYLQFYSHRFWDAFISRPTSVPSVDYYYDPFGPLYLAYTATGATFAQDLTGVSYTYFSNKGRLNPGACSSWNTFLVSALNPPVEGTVFSGITTTFGYESYRSRNYKNYHIHEVSFSNASCLDPTVVPLITDAMRSHVNLDVLCNGLLWRVFACNDFTSVCVGCSNGCTACPANNQLVRDFAFPH